MSYDAQTINSRSSLKRWSHSRRFHLACRALAPRVGDRILDYGTGDATLLRLLHARTPGASLVGFEPMMTTEAASNAPAGARIVASPLGLADFDKVACLEVLEHLDGSILSTAIDNLVAAARPGGLILVSVPIEVGPSVLAKNIVRAAAGALHENMTVANTILSALGRTSQITRKAENGFISSHVGFDWRALRENLLRRGLRENKIIYSPFGSLGPLVNSQVMMIFQR
jgi:2-polyprenyl-3-methyl-5-hydroxy-6-metoxy-1,4-benzoquinol methylase